MPTRIHACFLAAALALTLAVGCTRNAPPPEAAAPEAPEIPFRRDGALTFLRGADTLVAIDIEIAESDSARERGLMQRASLPERGGMLFLFPTNEVQSFWMANTPLSLDIIFVGADSQIVSIAKYTKPLSPNAVASAGPARYVVETRAGFADTHGLSETDRVRWRRE